MVLALVDKELPAQDLVPQVQLAPAALVQVATQVPLDRVPAAPRLEVAMEVEAAALEALVALQAHQAAVHPHPQARPTVDLAMQARPAALLDPDRLVVHPQEAPHPEVHQEATAHQAVAPAQAVAHHPALAHPLHMERHTVVATLPLEALPRQLAVTDQANHNTLVLLLLKKHLWPSLRVPLVSLPSLHEKLDSYGLMSSLPPKYVV